MKFGKLTDIKAVDFTLPDDPSSNQVTWDQASKTSPRKLYLGCTGWSMKEWIGKVYPKGSKAKDFLPLYTKQFNTIELNTTHYRIPDLATIQQWRNQSAADFKFCPKVPQTISHSRDLGLNGSQLRVFWDMIEGLEEHLGCCFIQLPPHFSFAKLEQLRSFLSIWPSSIPLAVEIRHPSWFQDSETQARWLELLHQHQKSAVITDVAGRRDVLHMGVPSTTTMIRFVGNGLEPSDYERADSWLQRLQKWFESGLETAYFFPHQPDNILAPEMTAYMASAARQIPNIQTRGPELSEIPGDQLSLF